MLILSRGFILGMALGITLVTATATLAQTAPSQAADLASMTAKAEADPALRHEFDQIRMMIQRRQVNQLPDLLLGRYGQGRNSLKGMPLNIRAISHIGESELRARYLSELLIADLDGDWQITREELKDTLEVRSLNFAAEAFFSYDGDMDNVLSTDEIKIATATQAQKQSRGHERGTGMLTLFDFDDDGRLTEEEFERGIAAMNG